jgi:hypothetical protein
VIGSTFFMVAVAAASTGVGDVLPHCPAACRSRRAQTTRPPSVALNLCGVSGAIATRSVVDLVDDPAQGVRSEPRIYGELAGVLASVKSEPGRLEVGGAVPQTSLIPVVTRAL